MELKRISPHSRIGITAIATLPATRRCLLDKVRISSGIY